MLLQYFNIYHFIIQVSTLDDAGGEGSGAGDIITSGSGSGSGSGDGKQLFNLLDRENDL